ncbi:T9SS type A sorting domain-containing protein [bacterium]|nr:T9SS type A sorting domain-containing protein [bacterium]
MRLLFTSLLVLFTIQLSSAELITARVKIQSPQEIENLRNLGAVILSDETPGLVDIIIDDDNTGIFLEAGYRLTDIRPISETGLDEIDPEYHTYEELTDTLLSLEAEYPAICKVDSIGHAQQFPRTIWCVKISDNVESEEDELAVLFIGAHHACEVMGMETLIHMISSFLLEYGSDPVITRWIDDYEIFFIPLLNPDGHYAVTQSINEFWRKNARDLNNNGIYYQFQGGTWWTDVTEGIDLNRNYDWYWEIGGSGDPRSYYYRGDSPFSESETQAVRDLGLEQHFVSGISFHSYGEVVIYPWNFNGQPSPDQDIYDVFALQLSMRFIRDDGGFYFPIVYDAQSGQCRNWFYGVNGGLFFCVELMPYPIFIPPGYELVERTQRYYNGTIFIIERLAGSGITGHIYDAVTGEPIYARVEIAGRISEQVNPRRNDPAAGRFTRLLNPGTYTVLAGARGYQTQRIENIAVYDTLTVVDIYLQPETITSDFSLQSVTVPNNKLMISCSPNPFNNETAVKITLPESGALTISVFNLMGQEVCRLFDGFHNAGTAEFVWNDTGGLPSGIYYIYCSSNGKSVGQKVLLLK